MQPLNREGTELSNQDGMTAEQKKKNDLYIILYLPTYFYIYSSLKSKTKK